MTKQELLDELERIKDGLEDQDTRWGIEGMCDDLNQLMWKINTEVDCLYTCDIDEEVSAEIQILKEKKNGRKKI